MEAVIIPAYTEDPVVAIRPYCGTTRSVTAAAAHLSSQDVEVYKTPLPAWADLGTVSHMQGAVVPEDAPKNSGTPHLKPKFQVGRWFFRFSAIVLSLLENLFCYLAYLQVAPPEDSFYNKFEAHMLGYPLVDTILLASAISNTCYLLGFWMMIALMRMDLYSSMVTGRLIPSLTAGGVCAALVFFGEGTKVFPFLCSICSFLHLLVWTCERIWPKPAKKKKVCQTIICQCFFFLFGGWLLSIIVMFTLESADYLYDSDCPATMNKAMPIRIKGVREWQCAKWGEPHYIRRLTPPGQPVYEALCSTSFHAFNSLVDSTTGQQAPSSEAHSVRCPSHCQDLGLGTSVIGCEVYSATSSICSAAVQMGILAANAGGLVKVVGRAPPPLDVSAGKYKRCDKNGILSMDMPLPETPASPAWAFYFQVDGMESLDMVTMHGWTKTSTPGAQEPWKSYVVDVTWVVGGTSQRSEVVLGPAASADIELNFCKGSASCV